LFGKDLTFTTDQFVFFQTLTKLPQPLPGRALIGQAYRLSRNTNTINLTGTSIIFQFLRRDVPPNETLKIFYLNEQAGAWTQLNTVVDTYYNVASAFVPVNNVDTGVGVYTLMASVDTVIYEPGWNLISFPVQTSSAVTIATQLKSIEPYYTLVYDYVITDTQDPWKMFAANVSPNAQLPVPAKINDLTKLDFSRVYWIYTTKPITLSVSAQLRAPVQTKNVQNPPSTFYGKVLAGSNFKPITNTTVTAFINGVVCGYGTTMDISSIPNSGNPVYFTVNVLAKDATNYPQCGAAGSRISFKIGSFTMFPSGTWNDTRLQYLDIAPPPNIFFRFVGK
jgi:hypothetical protein